jgi:hypothetical protein
MNVVNLPVAELVDLDSGGFPSGLRGCGDGEGIIDGVRPLIPPGKYQMRYSEHQTVKLFGRQAKVVVRLKVCTNGYVGVELERWYNAKRLIGKPARYGRFHVGQSCDLVREYAGILDLPRRFDRIPLSKLKDELLVGDVDTVTTDRNQRPLPQSLHYSVVRWLGRAKT